MTNFETITKDEIELANWLSDARIGCDMCPVETECSKDCGPIYDRCYRLILEWLERDEETEESRTCQDFRHVETRREFFMENPDEFEEWLRKINDGEVRYPVNKHRARTDKKYIGTCMCSNMKGCDVCPVPLDEDGLCDDMCDEWLDSPMFSEPSDVVPDKKKDTIWSSNIRRALKTVRTNSLIHDESLKNTPENDGLAGLHPDDVKAVKEILERARKSSPYNKGCEDGYIKALRDLADLVRTELYCPDTFYDEGVNTGLRNVIDVADYLMQKMKSEGVKNDE